MFTDLLKPFSEMPQAAAVHMADKALAAFVIIQAALKRSPRLQQYSQRADLNERMPDFQVYLAPSLERMHSLKSGGM